MAARAQDSAEVPTPEATPAAVEAPATEPLSLDTPEAETPAETPAPTEAVAAPAATSAPAPAATPAPLQSSAPTKKSARFNLKTARDDAYAKPVYFESMDNLLPTMELEYDLTLEAGSTLKVGDTIIDDQTFFFALVPISKLHAKMATVVGSKEASKPVFVMRWPEVLQTGGTLEIIARTGAVLWKQDVSEAKRNTWKTQLDIWKKGLEERGVKTARLPKTSVFSTQYGIADVASSGLKAYSESFRFCLTQAQGRAQSRLCSSRYVLRGSGSQLMLSKIKTEVPPRVLLQTQAAQLKQNVPVPRDMPTAFFAELSSGESYEFVATPNKLNLMDLTDTKKPDQIRIMAWGTRPTIPSVVLNPDQYSSFTRAIGFESTIGDMRKFWEATISAEDPKVYLPGQGGGLFTQRFELSEVPRANARPYLDTNTPIGTYDNGVKLFGKKLQEVKVTSFENSIEVDDKDPRYFLWRFKAADRGEINRSYLSMEYQGKEYKAFYEIYKGFPREISVRLSGILQPSGENVFLGEAAYNQWFENLFGWTNYWVGRQRWGISAKYFKTLAKLTVDKEEGTQADLAVANADLKYRFTPGLWGRDETLGAMLDYQDVTFGEIKAPMIGVGAFWARSMPKVFDDLFNLIPMMRYQKWVDMEFIFYPVSLTPTTTLQTNFSLNFHGKVLWSKHIFGEAGFGLKRYAITDYKVGQQAALNTFYGTLGLGLSF
ncbi:hypothetical protein [Bdellovibrio sp. HCB337]|uniref:hypothetical protein n=1 Tax=Bdellovibrio sp. HCB337 TaxID=3394358 RepID=UPI0039A775E4